IRQTLQRHRHRPSNPTRTQTLLLINMPNGLLRFLIAAMLAQVAGAQVFPYGAVYFRKSNPPEEDWAKDHQTAARLGVNTFRHWFMWSAIETAPGKYDLRDYDRMMDL